MVSEAEGYKRKRSYSPGRRNDKNVPKQAPGKLSRNRWAWARVYFGQFVIWADYVEDDGVQTDEVRDIKLVYPIPNRPPVTWNLTACTVEELDAIEDILTTAIAWARPVCEQRDQEAKDAFDQGDDTHSRIYRTAPQLVYRSGPIGEHSKGILDGSEDAAPLPLDGDDPGGSVRGVGPGVAELNETSGRAQDDGPTTDQPEGVRQVGAVGDGSVGVQGTDSIEDDPSPDPGGPPRPGATPPSGPHP